MGSMGLFRQSWGQKKIKEGAEKLVELRGKIRKNGKKEPKFLMVITGSDMAYTTKDGVLIVPVGCLKD